MKKEIKNYGRAYAFFYCEASKKEIESEIPTIRKLAKTPSSLELSLIEGVENLKGEKKLMSIAQEAKDSGMKYILKAKCQNATSEPPCAESTWHL